MATTFLFRLHLILTPLDVNGEKRVFARLAYKLERLACHNTLVPTHCQSLLVAEANAILAAQQSSQFYSEHYDHQLQKLADRLGDKLS